MKQIVYVSKSTSLFDVADLRLLNQKSRDNNAEVGVTGCMVFAAGYFLQLLEGDAAEVSTVMKRIAQDPRHTSTKVLLDRDVPESDRLFGRWFMSCINMDEQKAFPQELKDSIDRIVGGSKTSIPIPKLFMEFRAHLAA